jgi:hypothetical protein
LQLSIISNIDADHQVFIETEYTMQIGGIQHRRKGVVRFGGWLCEACVHRQEIRGLQVFDAMLD